MDLKRISNTKLIKLCASNPRNESAWLEFYRRFDERIGLVVYRECKERRVTNNPTQLRQIVQDLVQDVYMRLVENNCRALKSFKGKSENSIYTYLGIIAKNVVLNYVIMMGAQKRPTVVKSIDEIFKSLDKTGEITLKNSGKMTNAKADEKLRQIFFEETIDELLDKCVKGRDKERNKLIFKLYFFDGFSPEEITLYFRMPVSPKRIGNIIADIKQEMRREVLQKNMEIS